MAESTSSARTATAAQTAAATRQLARFVTVLAALCALVLTVLVVVHLRSRADDPLKSPQLTALKQQLLAEPKNEALKQQIRELDLVLRRRHEWLVSVYAFGTWFALAGAVLLVVAAKVLARQRAQPPSPQVGVDAPERLALVARDARRVALATGLVVLGGIAALIASSSTQLPSSQAGVDKLLAKMRGEGGDAVDLPTPVEFAASWPRFLGPTANAFAKSADWPLKFDPASGEGLRWKSPVTAPGFNSPLLWSNRVFLSGGDATNRVVIAYDLATGKVAWERPVVNVPGSPAKPPEIPESTGFAAPTMATDGRRVYAMFANGDLAAFTVDGAPAWSKNLGVPHNQYGQATSLATSQGALIMQYDQGEKEDNLSKLIAFDGASGRVLWQKPRPVGQSWATPVVFEAAGKRQIATLGGELVISYDAANGTELWRAQLLAGEITPSPIFAGGLVVAVSPSDRLFALRPDGAGDVTKSHLAWSSDENVPDVTSPVSNGELVFTATSGGTLTCFDLKDGKKLWEKDLDFEVSATPAIAGERLYVFGTKGPAVVAAAAREFKELARLNLGGTVHASPAFGPGVMVVRTDKSLICVGGAAAPEANLQAKKP